MTTTHADSIAFIASADLPADLDDGQVFAYGDLMQDGDLILSSSVAKNNSGWRLSLFCAAQPHADDLDRRLSSLIGSAQSLSWDIVANDPDTDWLAASYAGFSPFTVGRFVVHGSHHMALEIDAATAFGSGEHATTSLCLEAMQNLPVTPRNVLDMGTGSGILAIAAKKLWHCPVLAVDNDPESVRVTRHHALANHVDINSLCSEGFADPHIAASGAYDLIIANILYEPLRDMAADLVRNLQKPGFCILSGILEAQADRLVAAYNLPVHARETRDGWAALTLRSN